MTLLFHRLLLLGSSFLVALGANPSDQALASERIIPGHYIVDLKNSVSSLGAVALAQTAQLNGDLGFIYPRARGYSVALPRGAAMVLRKNPLVVSVKPDTVVELASQTQPTGLKRVFAPDNQRLAINESDDFRIDADVAVIDTGIEAQHPDLNVVRRIDCSAATHHSQCTTDTTTPTNPHGTFVAGVVGALDNQIGTVGIAPGARLWSIKIEDSQGQIPRAAYIAAIEWVTANAAEIEVANESLETGNAVDDFFEDVMAESIAAGVVHVAAAGNGNGPVNHLPGNYPDAITVSAIADFDGAPGGLADATHSACRTEYEQDWLAQSDDALANLSKYGSAVDIAAPGVCIYSTGLGGSYEYDYGTSVAAPYVAGAAAILSVDRTLDSKADVDAIRDALITTGNTNWSDLSGDGIKEPLLDVSLESVYMPPPSTSGSGWSTQYIPDPVGTGDANNRLYEVTCDTSSATACTAVGHSSTSVGVDSALIERWDGSGWSTQSAATPSGATESRLTGVSCASTTWCMAVGSYQTSTGTMTLAERWTGSGWSVISTPNPPSSTSAQFTKIWCTATTECTAVGYAVVGGMQTAFAQRWNGTNWSLQTVPLPSGATSSQLEGVGCRGTSFCMAVGSYVGSGGTRAWAVTWDGTAWSLKAVVEPSGATQTTLHDVSCTGSAPVVCTAVGGWKNSGSTQSTFVQRWNGSSLSLQSSPNQQGSSANVLQNVSCAMNSECTAVGSWVAKAGNQGANRTLAVHWDGANWSLEETPNVRDASFNAFFGVVCRTLPGTCMAVGYSINGSGFAEILGQHKFKWETQYLPDPPGSKTTLHEVNCEPNSANMCVAVGVHEASAGVLSPTALRWNGTSWMAESAATPKGATSTVLSGDWCSASTECFAVGHYDTTTGQATLAQRWNGASWLIQTTPNPSSATNPELAKVSCSAPGACTAVGAYVDTGSGKVRPLAMRWNGTTWTLQTVPLPSGAAAARLDGIGCKSSTFCMAVGQTWNSTNGWRALSMIWNGSSWSAKALAMPEGALESRLVDIGCVSVTECVAVGSYATTGLANRPLVQRWNGTAWSNQVAPLPAGSTRPAKFLNMSCASSTSCTAVGEWEDAAGDSHGFAATSDGANWETQLTPSPGRDTVLRGVSCRGTSCLAVGSYLTPSSSLLSPLAQRYEP